MSTTPMTVAEFIVKILEHFEVDTVFGYPGGAVLPLYDALPPSSIHSVLVRNEQGAAFAANGYARIQRRAGVCLATSGPGATNLLTGIADSYADSIPVVGITGQVPYSLIGTDAFQECDVTGCFLPITKRTYLITDKNDVADTFLAAFNTAISGRPGPVIVDIPKNIQAETIDISLDFWENFPRPAAVRTWHAEQSDLDRAQTLLTSAKKPLIISGHGILLSECWTDFRQFVADEQIPSVSTILGRDALKHDDPLYFSWLGMHGMKYANLAVQEADVILALGIRFDDRITGKLDTFAPKAKIIHVDIDASEYAKNVPTEVFLHGDLKEFFGRWPGSNTADNHADRQAWITELQNLRTEFPLKPATHDSFTEIAAIDTLTNLLPADVIVTTDVGQHQMWSGQYLRHLEPNHFMTSAGLGTMGFGLPVAMGAQAGAPDKEVWAICGDGSFQMNIQELITLSQEGWAVKILLLDNSYLGMVRQWQEAFYDGNYSGVALDNPDFVKIAEACRLEADEVNNVDELTWSIQRAQACKGPYLIHAKVLREENVLPMVPSGKSLSQTVYYGEL